MKQLIVVILVVFGYRTYGISISFDPAKPAFGDSVTISCRRSTSSTASVSWELNSAALTVCDATMDDICIPSPTGHTFSTDVSAKVFNLSLASVALTDCKTYTCTDTVTTSDTDSNELLIAKYDSSESVLTEPGAFSSGTITLTTGCVLSPTDVTVSWKKVKENNEEDDLDYEVKPPTADATGCTDTCHSETSEKVVSSFVHTEYSESDCEEVTFRAYIRHSSYAVESVKNSAGKYRVKKGSTSTSTTSTTTATSTTTSTSTTSTPTTSTPTTSISPPNVTDSDDKKIIIGVSVGVVSAVVLAILIGVCCFNKHRNKVRKQEHMENAVSYSNDQDQNLSQMYSHSKNRL